MKKNELHELLYPKPSDDLYLVFHDFANRFLENDSTFKYRGYEMMKRVERWAKNFPLKPKLSHVMTRFLPVLC